MQIAGRPIRRVVRAPLHRCHWRALGGMPTVYVAAQLPDIFRRFLSESGRYPFTIKLRTPTGVIDQVLQSRHDLLTVNEVFARRDYLATASLRVAVDVGAKIGIASRYFLTRNHFSRVYAIEPNPSNLVHLRGNLESYCGRYELLEVAAADSEGDVPHSLSSRAVDMEGFASVEE